MKSFHLLALIYLLTTLHATAQTTNPTRIITAAEQTTEYLPLLAGKNIGLVVNQSSLIETKHLLDTLLSSGITIKKIFAPEHGFRGNADRGAHITDGHDTKTGLPILSLHGKHKKPTPDQLKDIDLLLFDIQDVGVRFFTYISTMHHAMEAAAESGIPFLVLDRPNPLGDYIDGPIRKPELKSFIGMHPIPIVHGLTVGELAQMIKGEGWINQHESLQLTVIPCLNYTHSSHYELPIKPSPNLPNMLSIRLYPSLCFFEATSISIGRGTTCPFQQIGYPSAYFGTHQFIPKDITGMQTNPLHEGKICYGDDLSTLDTWEQHFTLSYFINYHKKWRATSVMVDRRHWFDLLAGDKTLLQAIEAGKTEAQIRASWQAELTAYKTMRKAYLLYPDFK